MAQGAHIDDEPIRILPYDHSWPDRFQREKRLLEQAIGPWIIGGVHHVGSTAVRGLAAKPVIDILVGVADLPAAQECRAELANLGYRYAPYRAEEMCWFCKPNPSHRTHQLHVVPSGSHRYRAELAFRDALRADSRLAEEYAALKQSLATKFTRDREAYTEGKHDFIANALARDQL